MYLRSSAHAWVYAPWNVLLFMTYLPARGLLPHETRSCHLRHLPRAYPSRAGPPSRFRLLWPCSSPPILRGVRVLAELEEAQVVVVYLAAGAQEGVDVLAADDEVDRAAERIGYRSGAGQRNTALGAVARARIRARGPWRGFAETLRRAAFPQPCGSRDGLTGRFLPRRRDRSMSRR